MLLGCMAIHAAKVNYTLSMPQPHTHYFEVEMTVEDAPADYVDLKMPVWAPGSYLVREFSRNVEGITASGNSSALKVEKLTKNTWRVHAKKAKSFTVKYKVYAFELSVRTSFVDASHGYVNGTSVFLFVDQKLDASGSLKVVPFKDWKTISTGLPAGAGFGEYTYANYDQLVDCPIEIGNHSEFEFTAAGVKHRVAMYGEGNYDVAKLKTDMAKIIQACTDVFGFNPNKEYVFIIHNLEVGSGGLEHSNSTTLQVDRWTYEGRAYIGFLSLVAHEYFHLWNVKRIRPRELGPFDYENEVYTSLLWIMEGFTSYYDELLLLRAGFYTPEQYMKKIASSITSIENQPGNRVLPLSEASMDAWIKLYRPNENSYNTTISYYTKGAVVAAMLDMKIIRATKGKKRLDDVLVYLYDTYYTKAKRGFTEAEAQKAFEEIAGESFEAFFNQYINGTEPLPYEDIASGIGITVERYKAADDSPYLGVRTAGSGGKLTVQMVVRNTSAYNSGLNVNDEIIAVNGFRVDQDQMDAIVDAHKAGDTLEFLIARGGLVMPLKVVLEPDPTREFVLQMGSKGMQDPLIAKWLGK
jgi:predicted metalloprotease with PDZ domain